VVEPVGEAFRFLADRGDIESAQMTHEGGSMSLGWRPKQGPGRPKTLPEGTRRVMFGVTEEEEDKIR
jgi:hypothetical protein